VCVGILAPSVEVVCDVEGLREFLFRRVEVDALPLLISLTIPPLNLVLSYLLEVSKNILPGPCGIFGASKFAPNVIVAGGPSLEDLAIHGGATADDAPNADVKPAVVELGAWLRSDVIGRSARSISVSLYT